MPLKDCSELSKLVAELAMDIAKVSGTTNLENIVEQMRKDVSEFGAIDKGDLLDLVKTSLVDATTGRTQSVEELDHELKLLGLAAKKDPAVRKAVKEARDALAKGEVATAKLTEAVLKMKEDAAELQGKIDNSEMPRELSNLANRLARAHIEAGIITRDELVDAVHADLLEALPGLTRNQVIAALPYYGQLTQLSKDATSVILRDLKGQLLQIAKLNDMAAGIAPKQTGQERRKQGDEERRLIKQVNEAKRKGGYHVTDPSKQLRTALGAYKTRLDHEIADLDTEIATRQKLVKTKTALELDAEAIALKQRRDERKALRDEIFGNPELTDEQRVAIAQRAVDKSIAEYERRIREGDFTPKKTTKTPETAELKAARKRRDELKRQYQAANPNSPELQRAIAKLAELQKHLDDGTLPPTRARIAPSGPPRLTETRRKIADVRRALAQSDPAISNRFDKSIAAMTKRLLDNDFAPPVKKERLPVFSELARKEFERDKIASEVRGRIAAVKPKTALEYIAAPLEFQRTFRTSFDVGHLLRQGSVLVVTHPGLGIKSLLPTFRAMMDPAKQHRIEKELEAGRNTALWHRAGLYMAPVDIVPGATHRNEESSRSALAQRIPGVAASQRAYITGMNWLRRMVADSLAYGWTNGEPTENQAKVIANFLNIASGRGDLGRFENAAEALSTALFSPRLWASRLQFLALQPVWTSKGGYSDTKMIRLRISGEILKYYLAMAAMYLLADAMGEAMGIGVEYDPRSSDFMKLKVGQTRVDLTAGLASNVVLAYRLASGQTKSARTGRVSYLYGPKKKISDPDAQDVVSQAIRSKASPGMSLIADLVFREDFLRRNTNIATLEGAGRLAYGQLPMSPLDFWEAVRAEGMTRGVALGIIGLVGASINTYDDDPRSRK